ncbi:MAG: hypothetical protein L3J07_01775 [Candidatus Magasanikbacteria bacterium]|nr:hypothetical protein [Candidatus Magasanikbacteria bacterium]
MFSQKTLTIMLVLAIAVSSYQTFMLVDMSKNINEAEIGIGSSPTSVSFTDDGSSPEMVGGC